MGDISMQSVTTLSIDLLNNGLNMDHNNTILTALYICFESETLVYSVSDTALKYIKDELKERIKSETKVITFDVKMCYKI